ncbi:MAG: ATP-binding protein [Actinomycetota bacterium]
MPVSLSSDELDDLFYRLPVAIYRTSAEGEVLAANQVAAQLLGYDNPDELVAQEYAAAFAYADEGRREEWRSDIERYGVVHDFQARLRRRDGSIIWVRDTARAVFGEDGSVRFYEGVLVDITSEIRASMSSSILSGVLESTTDLVVVFDDNPSLRYANGAARSFLGLTEESVHSRPAFGDVVPDLDWDKAIDLIDGRGWSGEVTVSDRNGEPCSLWVVVTSHRGPSEETFVAAIARDVTHVKATQRRLESLITAKDVFVATVSHELRNPLAGIMGLAEEMRDGFDDFGDQERHDLITLIAHQAAEMTALVEDLLVAARDDVSEVAVVPEATDVVAHLSELRTLHSDQLAWELPDEPVMAWVDPQRFRQIIRNLITNAERHGGSSIAVKARREKRRVVVEVADDGDGVPPDEVERIFQPYQRSSKGAMKTGSVGLGLNVARRLARLMGGDLEYVGQSKWATFRLSLPLAEELSVEAS